MRRAFRAAAAVAAALVGGPAVAQIQVQIAPALPPIQGGGGIARPGGPVAVPATNVQSAHQRTLNSQAAFAGTVSQEKEPLEVEQYKGSPVKVTYKVFTLKVTDALVGEKAEKVKILVGSGDFANLPYEQPGQPPQPYYPGYLGNVQLIDGQEGVFFLTKHPSAPDAWTITGGCPPLNPLDTKHKDDLAAVKAVAATYADPIKALKAEKAEDKMRAVSVLMTRYSRANYVDGRPPERKAIAAEESKLIFEALLAADWEKFERPQPGEQLDYTLSPMNYFYQLQLPQGKGDGQFTYPQQGGAANLKAALKAWREGGGKDFVISRFTQPGEKGDEPKKDLPKKDLPRIDPPKDGPKPDVIRPDVIRPVEKR